MIRWAAVILASLSWLYAFDLYVVPRPALQWAWIAAAMVLATIGLRRFAGRVRLSASALLLLVPLAVIIGLADGPYRPAAWLLAAGLIVAVLGGAGRTGSWLQPAGLAGMLLGTILVVQSPCAFAVQALTARYQEVPLLSAAAYAVLKWLGCDVSYNTGTVFYRTMRDVYPFPLTWGHVDLLTLLAVWLAGVMVMLWRDRRGRWLGAVVRVSALLSAYALGRLVMMIVVFGSAMIFVEHEEDIVHVAVFWMPWIVALSWLPLIPVLAGLLPWRARSAAVAFRAGRWQPAGGRALALVAASLACAGAVAAVYFPDPGLKKQGRVLLDESHSQWERTDNVYDTDWYGHESGYNYYCIAQYLDRFYDLDFNMDGDLTPEKLAGYDVLILKTPTQAYSEEELQAIEALVQGGGGLFALGEHTNVFGSSTFLNPVVRRFGMAFRQDVVFDIERKWEQVHFPGYRLVRGGPEPQEPEPQEPTSGVPTPPGAAPAQPRSTGSVCTLRARQLLLDYLTEMIPPEVQGQIQSIEKHNEEIGKKIDLRTRPRPVKATPRLTRYPLGVHPIVQWMPLDRFAVSCSIASDWSCRSVIRSTGLWTLPIDYTAGNFYPNVEDKSYAKFGAFDQMVAAQVGQGRVVGFGDSTVYSNFMAFYPGKAEKLLGAVEWLNRRNRFAQAPRWGGAVFLIGLIVVGLLRGTRLHPHLGFSAALAACGAASAWLTLWACTAAARTWYPPPVAHEPVHTVVFDLEHSAGRLPIFGFIQGKDYASSYEIFYQWILRLGFFTDASFDLQQALRGPGPIVIIRPREPQDGDPAGRPVISSGTQSALRAYLERGGALLLLDSPDDAAALAAGRPAPAGSRRSASAELLGAFGMSFAQERCRGRSVIEPASGARICALPGGLAVTGGQPLLVTEAGETVAAVAPVGQGWIIAAGLAERFADTQMGVSSRGVPNHEIRAAFEMEYALIRGLVQGDVQEQIRKLGEIYRPAPSAAGTSSNQR